MLGRIRHGHRIKLIKFSHNTGLLINGFVTIFRLDKHRGLKLNIKLDRFDANKRGKIMTTKRKKMAISLALALNLQAFTFQPLGAATVGHQAQLSEAEIFVALAGKTLTSGHYTLTLNTDNSFDGFYQGRPIWGNWILSAGAICLDMYTSIHCRTPNVEVGNVTTVRFERSANSRQRLYLQNPHPNLWAQYTVSE